MQVVRFSTFDQLATLATHWDRLSRGVPFRGWAWMSNWWRHYGANSSELQRKASLFTLGVFDESGVPLGIAPWYCEHSASQGRVLRFLGLEEVCADYLSVLCLPEMEHQVTAALADWLTDANRHRDGWDLIELMGVDAEDRAVRQLVEQLQARGNKIHRRDGPNCWRIELPNSWEQYLQMLSKSHRKQLRRMQRDLLSTSRAVMHCVERPDDLAAAEKVLVDLHQRRRRSLGEPGCFASSQFAAFHGDLMPELLDNGQLRMIWAELDGQPAVAEYHLSSNDTVYAYQAGVNPDILRHSPGELGNLVTVRRAIEQGYRTFDFLRGDEPYKAHWRAEPRRSVEFRVAAARTSAQLRHNIWLAGSSMKQWVKTSFGLTESPTPNP